LKRLETFHRNCLRNLLNDTLKDKIKNEIVRDTTKLAKHVEGRDDHAGVVT